MTAYALVEKAAGKGRKGKSTKGERVEPRLNHRQRFHGKLRPNGVSFSGAYRRAEIQSPDR
jgi:retron-type reverse transcriptase